MSRGFILLSYRISSMEAACGSAARSTLLSIRDSSCRCSHEQNYAILLAALHITIPSLKLDAFCQLLLTRTEMELLIQLAQEALYLGRCADCSQICSQLAIVQAKDLLYKKEYEKAWETIQTAYTPIARSNLSFLVCPLFFLSGLCAYRRGDLNTARKDIHTAFYGVHALDSCYATACLQYLLGHTDFPVSDYMKSLPVIPMTMYPPAELQDISAFSDGIYSADNPEAYTLNNLIRDLRQEQHLSQTILCQGLCSKSKLSKIENGSLQPDIALIEALLQRLGLSERIFTFWGTEKEAKFHELKLKLLPVTQSSDDPGALLFQEMTGLINQEQDMLYLQEYLFEKETYLTATEDKLAILFQALYCTLPNFDIHNILHYRLSWMEINILNGIAVHYRQTKESYLSSLYSCQLLEYCEKIKPSFRLRANTFSLTLRIHCHSLYTQKHFSDILDLYRRCDRRLLKHALYPYASFLFYYSQALGESGLPEQVNLPAVYSCSLELLAGFPDNSSALENALYDDFAIKLLRQMPFPIPGSSTQGLTPASSPSPSGCSVSVCGCPG